MEPDSKAPLARINLYLGILIVLLAFGAPGGGLIGLPVSFVLKNKLHLSAHQVATFLLLAATPLYLSGLFGFARDLWNPLGRGDRGFMLLFGGIGAALYLAFSAVPVTYASLLLAMLLLTSAFLFVQGAQNGLTAALGQRHRISGRISAAWNIFGAIPGVVALLAGGRLSELLEAGSADHAARALFLLGAAIMAAIAGFSLWRPASVFDSLPPPTRNARPGAELRRLLRHRPIYPALLIRACPPGLQGSVLMFSGALYTLASRFGDALGTVLYDRFGGFEVCVLATTAVYALILPVLWLVPRALVARADG